MDSNIHGVTGINIEKIEKGNATIAYYFVRHIKITSANGEQNLTLFADTKQALELESEKTKVEAEIITLNGKRYREIIDRDINPEDIPF